MPKGRYKGQNDMADVNIKTAAKTKAIIPKVPIITFVKYMAVISAAASNLIIRSVVPIFAFMISMF